MIIGYARTSTIDQRAGFEAELKELEGVKCEKIFREQVSSVAVRIQLEAALEFGRQGPRQQVNTKEDPDAIR